MHAGLLIIFGHGYRPISGKSGLFLNTDYERMNHLYQALLIGQLSNALIRWISTNCAI